ncbi:hypothetical protein [Mycobacterium ahvazicum]|nr:hypothetical protein [Mycobacterium ahvazicum]
MTLFELHPSLRHGSSPRLDRAIGPSTEKSSLTCWPATVIGLTGRTAPVPSEWLSTL